MSFPKLKKGLSAFPFVILLAVGFLGLRNLGVVQYQNEWVMQLFPSVEFPMTVGPGPPVSFRWPAVHVICPKKAYESETVRLTVLRNGLPKKAKPLTFTVETSEKIEVQGNRQHEVLNSADWFLIPKEQGEYVVVVRGLEAAKDFQFAQPLSVYKFDHISRRWYVALGVIAGVVGLIGTLKKLFEKSKESTSP